MSTHVPPPTNDDLFSTRTDEELASAISDVDEDWIATELMSQGDGLSKPEALAQVREDRTKAAAKVMRGLTDE